MSTGVLRGSVSYGDMQDDIGSNFGTGPPDGFCLPCFLKGLKNGAMWALAGAALVFLLPEAGIFLAAVGIVGLITLAARMPSMDDREKSEALGQVVGGVLVGGAVSNVMPPPGPGLAGIGPRLAPVGPALEAESAAVPMYPGAVNQAAPGVFAMGTAAGAGGGGSGDPPGGDGDKSESTPKPQGGAYKDIDAEGGEVHHMPAKSVSPLSQGEGPGIRMETADHRRTASWGRSKDAAAYRAKQADLIDQGRFDEAQQMDIDDVRSKFDDKYDPAIEEMQDYTKTIDPARLKPK